MDRGTSTPQSGHWIEEANDAVVSFPFILFTTIAVNITVVVILCGTLCTFVVCRKIRFVTRKLTPQKVASIINDKNVDAVSSVLFLLRWRYRDVVS